MAHAFVQALCALKGSDRDCKSLRIGITGKISDLWVTAGFGLFRREGKVAEIRTTYPSAIGLAQPKRSRTSFVVSWMRVPGRWNSRVALARTLARRKRFGTLCIALKIRSERIVPSGNRRLISFLNSPEAFSLPKYGRAAHLAIYQHSRALLAQAFSRI